MRKTPKKPASKEKMPQFLSQCRTFSCIDRRVLSHTIADDEAVPRPCTAPIPTPPWPRCKSEEMLDREKLLSSDTSNAGKARYSAWRMEHARAHYNIQPGNYGKPMFEHHMNNQLLDSLHLAMLNLPKIAWKHAVLNNVSDDARVQISDMLAEWRHPLDTRRKDDNRVRALKWFSGEKWASFCAGEAGSPGGPPAIAALMLQRINYRSGWAY